VKAILLVAAVLLAAGCTKAGGGPEPSEGPFLRGSGTLRVLAGSELTDLQPVLDAAAKATGVTVTLTSVGTLEGVDAVVNGSASQQYDAIWFSSNRYLELHPDAARRIGPSTKVAASPVVLGLRTSVAKRLGWDAHRPTWSEIATAAGARKFTYGMTNPATSNSGFSALVGVATALAGTGAALNADQIAPLTPRLRAFFAGQTLTAGSSGWLADSYLRAAAEGRALDGLVNYESVLLSLNASGKLPEPLTVVYPADGAVTADYPLTLLASASEQSRTNYAAIADYLRRPSTQRTLMTQTFRRPTVPNIKPDAAFGPGGGAVLPELPFPARVDAANALITAFGDALRTPARAIYVLDLSGSMKGDRLQGLKTALVGLTGVDQSLAGQFARFNGREQVVLLPFSTRPGQPRRFDLPESGLTPTLEAIRAYANGLTASGDTALYDALDAAYGQARALVAEDPSRFTSIVLLTDGERTTGADFAAFKARNAQLAPELKGVPVFTILFGEANVTEMTEVATMTGGRSFDARTGALSAAFREIRGYQ
jgi:Ca-activated chloride channel homolog